LILVDTNVISETMKPSGSLHVLSWLDRQMPGTLFMSTTTMAEILVGIQVLPEGKRKDNLTRVFDTLSDRLFRNRILPFDEQAAIAYSEVVASARKHGRAIAIADGQIAAIASVHGFTVATRDTAPFLAAGVSVLNPWQE
jgi:predicted nucleic acid-binding protein